MPSQSPAANAAYARIRRARPLLGTLVEIEVAADRSRCDLHAAIDAAFGVVEQVQSLMSYHDADSELSRLNRTAAAGAQRVDPRMYTVLQAALRFARMSDGAFDPCVAPCLERLGVLPRVGKPIETSATWRDIKLSDGDRVQFLRPLRLDLGGVAKGFAVDAAVESLQNRHLDEVLVNAGGDLRIAGGARSIALRDPHAPGRSAHTLAIEAAALATSAAYFSRANLGDGQVSALIDGRSRQPYLGNRSVSVRADTCMTADALTKVVLFAQPSIAERCLTRFGAQAFVLGAVHFL